MAVLALAYVGSAVGSYIGIGASAGYLIGSYLGSMLTAEGTNTSGPKLSDTSVNISSYGSYLPIVYGRHMVTGNIIWSTDKVPTDTTTSQGGKGGPSSSVTTTTYHIDMAVALCETTQKIVKVFANNKLIADYSASGSVTNWLTGLVSANEIALYNGSTTQTADPTMEAALGAGNVPGYRGTCYVVLKHLQLEDYGNQVPQISAEVISGGSTSTVRQDYTVTYPSLSGAANVEYIYGGPITSGGEWIIFQRVDSLAVPAGNTVISSYTPESYGQLAQVSVGGDYSPTPYNCGQIIGSLIDTGGLGSEYTLTNASGESKVYSAPAHPHFSLSYQGVRAYATWSQYSDRIAQLTYLGTTSRLCIWDYYDQTLLATVVIATSPSHCYVGPDAVYVSDGSNTLKYDRDTGALLSTIPAANGYVGDTVAGIEWHVDDYGVVWAWYHATAGRKIWYLDGSDVWQLAYSGAPFDAAVSGTNAVRAAFIIKSGMMYVFRTGNNLKATGLIYNLNAISSSGVTVASIATDIADRANMSITTTALTGSIDGFSVTRQVTARQALDTLRSAVSFDGTVDSTLKLVTRTASAVAAIPTSALGADDNGPSDNILAIRREQPLDIPTILEVNFADNTAEYVLNSAVKSNPLSTSSNTEVIDLSSVAMTPDFAAKVADARLTELYRAQSTLSFSTNMSYYYLEPTDVVTLTKEGISYTVQLTAKTLSGGKITWEAAQCASTAYASIVSGGGNPGSTEAALKFPPAVAVLDIPLLRDSDNSNGPYVAVATTNASGVALYTGLDDSTVNYEGTISTSALMGVTTTALATTAGLSCIDEVNTLTVTFSHGTPSSITTAALIAQGNIISVGSEIIAYRDATLSSGTTYVLSGLLRGLYGTEQSVATHVTGERVIGLATNAGLLKTTSDYLDTVYYRAAPLGGLLGRSIAIKSQNTGIAVKPYAPARLLLSNNGSTDRLLTWSRRTRFNINVSGYAGTPLGEASEQYNVYIYSSAAYTTILRTIVATSETATYTAAFATADFGSMPGTLHWGVAQVSALVGAGRITNISTTT